MDPFLMFLVKKLLHGSAKFSGARHVLKSGNIGFAQVVIDKVVYIKFEIRWKIIALTQDLDPVLIVPTNSILFPTMLYPTQIQLLHDQTRVKHIMSMISNFRSIKSHDFLIHLNAPQDILSVVLDHLLFYSFW